LSTSWQEKDEMTLMHGDGLHSRRWRTLGTAAVVAPPFITARRYNKWMKMNTIIPLSLVSGSVSELILLQHSARFDP
jgi:hypothetical protein